MRNTKIVMIVLVVIIVVGLGLYALNTGNLSQTATSTAPVVNETGGLPEGATSTPTTVSEEGSEVVIGKSVEGRDIVAYNYGDGETRVLFVGGIHGGYSWVATQVAYQAMEYFKANPSVIPSNVKVTVIPNLNPDGLFKAIGKEPPFAKADVTKTQSVLADSRFNANKVDLSRNFDCNWKEVGTWQTKPVSGGSSPFSEPESLAIKNYAATHNINGAVVWYAAAGGVYASSCGSGILPETTAITDVYAKASGYVARQNFDNYTTTGDIVNWLAKESVPAISVILKTHNDTDWNENKKGIDALLSHYAK